MSYTYGWKPGAAGFKKGDPQAIGEALEAIKEAEGGRLATASVVRHARSNKSPLHGCFEWNNGKAASAYRKMQARNMIASLVIHVETQEKQVESAFVNVVLKSEKGADQFYTTEHEAMSDDRMRAYVLEQAKREAARYRDKYKHLRELSRVVQEITALLEE